MASTKRNETLIGREVERAFANISEKPGDVWMNPITGEPFERSWIEHENIGGCTELPFAAQQLPEMKKRYPPRKLEGLEWFNWRPPRRQKQPKETRRAA